jgi:hypothetical protein
VNDLASGTFTGEAPFDAPRPGEPPPTHNCEFIKQTYLIDVVPNSGGGTAQLTIDGCAGHAVDERFPFTGTFEYTFASGTLTGGASAALDATSPSPVNHIALDATNGTDSWCNVGGPIVVEFTITEVLDENWKIEGTLASHLTGRLEDNCPPLKK